MKTSMKKATLLIALIVIILLAFLAAYYFGLMSLRSAARVGFREKASPYSWSAQYTRLDGTMKKVVYAGENDMRFSVETQSGILSILVTAADGSILLERDSLGTESFSIPTSGRVVITIRAKGHQGGFVIGG